MGYTKIKKETEEKEDNGKKDKEDTGKHENRVLALIIILVLITVLVLIGTLGFKLYEGHTWLNSFYNGVLTFTGTNVALPAQTSEGKIFISLYNLFSTIFILFILSIIIKSLIGDNDFIF